MFLGLDIFSKNKIGLIPLANIDLGAFNVVTTGTLGAGNTNVTGILYVVGNISGVGNNASQGLDITGRFLLTGIAGTVGVGGSVATLYTGNGYTGTTATAGGAFTIYTGAGGASVTLGSPSVGGGGGSYNITLGAGGTASGGVVNLGGAGGGFTYIAGNGGTGSTNGGSGGGFSWALGTTPANGVAAKFLWKLGSTELMRLTETGKLGIGVAALTAYLHIKAGTATAGTAPIKLEPGIVLTNPEMGTIEYVDIGSIGTAGDLYFSPKDNGSATRHKVLLTVGTTSLTSGRVPYASSYGRVTDSANMTFDGTTLTATAMVAGGMDGQLFSLMMS